MDPHTDLYEEIEKSFPKIEKLFTKEFLLRFAQTSRDDLEQYVPIMAPMIQLKLLKPRNVLRKKFARQGWENTDIMAMLVIGGFHQYMRRKK